MAQDANTYRFGPKKLSLPEFLGLKAGGRDGSNMRDASGRQLSLDEARAGGPVTIPGWHTGGIGPGVVTHGYSQSQHAQPSGLNQLYLQNDPRYISPNRQLQNQRAMDRSDPRSAFFVDQAARAQGMGDYDQAAFWRQQAQNEAAQQMMGQGGGGMAWQQNPDGAMAGARNWGTPSGGAASPAQQPYFYPGQTQNDAGGNKWQYNANSGHGDMIQRAPNFAQNYGMQQQAKQDTSGTWVPGRNLGEGTIYNPYGTASVSQSAAPTTFTSGQGSTLGGAQFTGQQGTQNAADFFGDAANRQGIPNKYAAVQPGYGGTRDESFTSPTSPMMSSTWKSYQSAMSKKKLL